MCEDGLFQPPKPCKARHHDYHHLKEQKQNPSVKHRLPPYLCVGWDKLKSPDENSPAYTIKLAREFEPDAQSSLNSYFKWTWPDLLVFVGRRIWVAPVHATLSHTYYALLSDTNSTFPTPCLHSQQNFLMKIKNFYSGFLSEKLPEISRTLAWGRGAYNTQKQAVKY